MNDKVCVTTYVWGDKYQLYVPIAVYSIKKMYPEYDVIIFLHDKLSDTLRDILVRLNLYDKIVIKEHVFSDCPNMNAYKAKAFRWVLWDDSFLNYDYIYTIDIDMFYIKEPLPLHEQHIYHMKNVTGLPFDNMRRVIHTKDFPLNRQVMNFLWFVKKMGIKYAGSYLCNCRKDIMKLSGLHFVDVKKYYGVLTVERISHYREMVYNGSYVKYTNTLSDEPFLYFIVKESGFDVDQLASQDFNDPYAHTNFNNYDKALFRPTHGIHMGDFRDGFPEEKIKRILKLESERYYRRYMEDVLLKDDDFMNFLRLLPEYVLVYFKHYFRCNGIEVMI